MEQIEVFQEALVHGSRQFGLSLNDNHLRLFTIYFQNLILWNEKINLTAVRDPLAIAYKHFLDSLACHTFLPISQNSSLLDIGSGAGFPGLPVKILYPDLAVTLLEPSQKKTSFLRYVIGTLNLKNISVISKTIRQFSEHGKAKFVAVVTRALKIDQGLKLVRNLLLNDGRLILYRSTPIHVPPREFKIVEEVTYELPSGFGKRALSILEPL